MNLLADDQCRNCYHAHPKGTCIQTAEDPGPDGPVYSLCGCMEYVDLEAQSHIVVKVEKAMKDTAQAEDERRELHKVLDTLLVVESHFRHEAEMNAALHMSREVRPAPLAAAVGTAVGTLERLLQDDPEEPT